MDNKRYFNDYEVDINKRSLTHKDQTLAITGQGFEVLLYFLNHAGELVTRDELIEQAWKNKVVSDATLYKQIQRLRSLLGDENESKEIIQTVHGQGFIFTPEVFNLKPTIRKVGPGIKQRLLTRTKNLMLVLIGSAFIIWLFSVFNPSQDEPPIVNIDAVSNPLVLSVLPAVEAEEDFQQSWIAYGGMYYLLDKFKNNLTVKIKRLSKNQINTTNAEDEAIKLTHDKTIDAALILSVNESNGRFTAQVTLRNGQGVVAEKPFESMSAKELLDQIHGWASTELKVDESTDSSQSMLSENSYAVESFIRGMAAQHTGLAAEAIAYFESATQEDSRFWKAWYELSIAYRKQGENNKALSILKTLEETNEAEPLHLGVQNAKSLALWRLGKHQQALEAIDKTIVIAENKNSPVIPILLTNKSIIASELGDLATAEAAINRSIQINKEQENPSSSSLGSAYNTLAGIKQMQFEFAAAEQSAKQALQYFQAANDKRYITTVKSRLSSIYMDLGQYKTATSLITNNLIQQQTLNDVPGQISNQLKLFKVFMITGKIQQASKALQDIDLLFNETNNDYLLHQFLAAQTEYHLYINDYQLAANYLAQLNGLQNNDTQRLEYLLLKLEWAHATKNWVDFDASMKMIKQDPNINQNPMYFYWQSQKASSQNMQAKAITSMGYAVEALQTIPIKPNVQAKILLAHAQLVTDQDINLATSLISRIEKLNPSPYPYLLTKAAIHAKQGAYFEASALLEELKIKGNDHWQPSHQLLLESYLSKINN